MEVPSDDRFWASAGGFDKPVAEDVYQEDEKGGQCQGCFIDATRSAFFTAAVQTTTVQLTEKICTAHTRRQTEKKEDTVDKTTKCCKDAKAIRLCFCAYDNNNARCLDAAKGRTRNTSADTG
jgi:hypothetical protein